MNLNEAIKMFNKYVNGYDMNDKKIKLKYIHTYKVVDISEKIARSLNLSKEDIELAKLIGLLHDIGRFEQIKKYDSFKDKNTMDHADYGVQILFKDNLIRQFIDDDKYDEIIKTSIAYHNKFKLPDNLDSKTELFAKIIRDADKIDIYRVRVNEYQNKFVDKPNHEALKEFFDNKQLKHEVVTNKSDSILLLFAMLYDINFKESFKILKETQNLNNFINSIEVSNINEDIFKEIIENINNLMEVDYVKQKIQSFRSRRK